MITIAVLFSAIRASELTLENAAALLRDAVRKDAHVPDGKPKVEVPAFSTALSILGLATTAAEVVEFIKASI